MRYLAIDLGGKRTGLASGDDITGIVTPLEVVTAAKPEHRLQQIQRILDREGPDAIVIGLPLNMDGTAGPAAAAARSFGDTLRERTGIDVRFHDERLTSHAADQAMARSGLTHGGKKARRDAVAAAVILKDFLAMKR
jgi:putative holliday junction resolvase